MIRLDVWITFCDGQKSLCGEILCEAPDSHGRTEGEFRYAADYLNMQRAFALDPVSLPLTADIFKCPKPSGVFAVFEDSLPDDWGRRLLIRKVDLPRGRQNIPEMLNALGGNGLGALSYFQNKSETADTKQATVLELETLLDAAQRFEKGEIADDPELRMLFNAGSSPGGARPKVLVADADDIQWIAKFPSIKDTLSIVRIETAALSIAKKAGICIPEFKMIPCGGKEALLIQRFDISGKTGRKHMITMQTLLKAEGWYNAGYQDLIDVLRKYSCQPEIDIPAIYRQMVFNAFIGNTDDHLKNFTLLHEDKKGFYLSPAYDLLPNINNNPEHVLNFKDSAYPPGKETLLAMGKRAGVTGKEKIVRDVIEAVSGWEKEFKDVDVPTDEIKRLAPDIERRLKK